MIKKYTLKTINVNTNDSVRLVAPHNQNASVFCFGGLTDLFYKTFIFSPFFINHLSCFLVLK